MSDNNTAAAETPEPTPVEQTTQTAETTQQQEVPLQERVVQLEKAYQQAEEEANQARAVLVEKERVAHSLLRSFTVHQNQLLAAVIQQQRQQLEQQQAQLQQGGLKTVAE